MRTLGRPRFPAVIPGLLAALGVVGTGCASGPSDSEAPSDGLGSGGALDGGGGISSGGSDSITGGGGAGGGVVGAGGGAAGTGGSTSQPEGQPLFVAQGHVGRTTVSCDGGVTWVADQSSLDDFDGTAPADVRCFVDDVDCDHHGFPGRGLVFGEGSVYATFGWGDPGQIQKSTDGESWGPVLEGTTFGGLAYVQGALIAGARGARRSVDAGATWSDTIETNLEGWNVRRVGQTASHGERVILVGEAGDAVVSSDGGLTWWKPDTFPSGCGAGIQGSGGIAASDTVWLVVGGEGSACRSTDGGVNWTETNVGGGGLSHLVHVEGGSFPDGRFMVWGTGVLYSSDDGASWEQTETSLDVSLGAVAASDAGELVAVRGGWQTWYEDQRFYRSDDGVTWTEAESYVGSHPIRDIEFGYATRPPACD